MEELRERVAAVERALTDGESDLTALAEGAAAAERVDSLAAGVERLEDDVAELQAATQALRGYVGNIRSVNEGVENRADGALAAVEKLDERVESLEEQTPNQSRDGGPRTTERGDRATRAEPPTGRPSGRSARHQTGANSEHEMEACRACGRPRADERTGPAGKPATGPKPRTDGRVAAHGRTATDGGDAASKSATRGQSRLGRPDRQLPRGRGRDGLTAESNDERVEVEPTEDGLLQRFRERL